ncbi:hypothetical protein CLAFUW4_03354 [Fulvia fulva]|uniref:Uncharacterized protein n=1 Tax=Passalora fulva TaxID=5499 RepID=A0A9Q8LA58_PASFU|nr:uncharacterized protein CLAFUR5_03334 [Fulvia fulva]KAK4631112.1 hypothetical protein CLAFUR4_03343 [Fulvia fulva]KAK4633867.1 hypothetical protein CLAFUR0_03348 [Fulvia fulva]UJO13672.1 hypothetical protein CLAFUR5_03334 [Fulvia fulva]WPV10833.1 hypothetical protein CLAFUW4_03354 [Fulvia fulva]WPV26800.1 hypothetical protein CLAFUW7_03346 [Fulvia fulva]
MLVHNKVQGQNSNHSLFKSVGRAAKEDLHKTLSQWGKKCKDIIEKGHGKIKNDFQSRYQEADVKQEDDPKAVSKLLDAVKKAGTILDGDMRRHLFECHKYENDVEAMKEWKQAEMRQRHRA